MFSVNPAEDQTVEFWTNHMSREGSGISGVFRSGEFWSEDLADRWSFGEIKFWTGAIQGKGTEKYVTT